MCHINQINVKIWYNFIKYYLYNFGDNMEIGFVLSKAIKEGKWVKIEYLNKNDELTNYWIAINDIKVKEKILIADIYNHSISYDTIRNAMIYFEKIKSAQILDFCSYDVDNGLIDKIEKNLEQYEWLHYSSYNHNILNYYIECNRLDNDPFQKSYTTIPGIDLNILRENKKYKLNDAQINRIIRDIYLYDINSKSFDYKTLVINALSIDCGKKKYVVAYYEVTFNPNERSLILNKQIRFNKSFMIDGQKNSLQRYLYMDLDVFCEEYESNKETYHEIIRQNCRYNEYVNTIPEMMLLERKITVELEQTYLNIAQRYKNNELSVPLKAFFGNNAKKYFRQRINPSLIIKNKSFNINQMRVLFSSLKYPITYVQGPPGTGKTQIIVNVVLSAFYNSKKILVCSSNNRPVDGIIEKLSFRYRDQEIPFPYLRLGNNNEVAKATLQIKNFFENDLNGNPNEEILNKIKSKDDVRNKKLFELLEIQEKRIELVDWMKACNKLLKYTDEKEMNSLTITTVKSRIKQLEEELNTLKVITNDDIISLFSPLETDASLSSFLYFKSLEYIQKLKKPRFKDLIEICSIEDDDERVNNFNKYIRNNDNMKKLQEVFPIIFSTNISSEKLGRPDYTFDLVVMDEAGQCNVATALLLISKALSLLLVGDPNQLRPVIVLDKKVNEELLKRYNISQSYSYKENSIFDIMREHDNISKFVLLKYHYRCGKKIINYSNQRYYNNQLNLSYILDEGNLEFLDIKSRNVGQKNESIDEAIAIIKYLKRNNIKDAYIVTPFVNQKELINKLLESEGINGVSCGTIHSVQGAENDTVILSSAISLKTSKMTFEWVKNNYELINVAITRAKKKLIIAADDEAICKLSDKTDDLYNLIQYAKENGKIVIPPNETVKLEVGKSNDSQVENIFYKTITHFCSVYKSFDVQRNVKLSKLFNNKNYGELEFDCVLFKRTAGIKKPVYVFEINGGEHLGNLKREKSDRRKMLICKKEKVKLIFIPNSFAKEYGFIINIINASKRENKHVQISLFD